MSTAELTSIPAPMQAERHTLPIGEYVRLFQSAAPGRGVFVRYFWHRLETLDQILVPLHAYFGNQCREAISPTHLEAYISWRRAKGVTDKAIREELWTFAALRQDYPQHVGKKRRRRRRKCPPELRYRAFFAHPQAKQPPTPPPTRLALPPGDAPVQPIVLEAIVKLEQAETSQALPPPARRTFRDVERDLLLTTLRSTQGNRTRTAELLGISLRGLHYKLKRLREQGGPEIVEMPGETTESAEPVHARLTLRCPQCAQEFQPRSHTQRYCSPACRLAHGQAALHLAEAGVSIRDIAKRLGVPYSSVYHAMQTAREAKQQEGGA